MTFTFEVNPFDDIARVRLAIGDTDASAPIFTDELITGLIADHDDDWEAAAIAAVENIIAQLLAPAFELDWLKVDPDKAVKGYERLLARLQANYGEGTQTISVNSGLPSRVDADSTASTTDYGTC